MSDAYLQIVSSSRYLRGEISRAIVLIVEFLRTIFRWELIGQKAHITTVQAKWQLIDFCYWNVSFNLFKRRRRIASPGNSKCLRVYLDTEPMQIVGRTISISCL